MTTPDPLKLARDAQSALPLPALWLAWNTSYTGIRFIRFWTSDAAVAEAQAATGLAFTGFYSAEQMRAAIDALPASVPSGEPAAPSICRVIAKGGKYTRGLYENPTRDHLLAWESDGDAVQWLSPIGSATTAPAPQADPNAGMGLPSCGKPLCSEGDHHPLCTMYLAAQAAPATAPMADLLREACKMLDRIGNSPEGASRDIAEAEELQARIHAALSARTQAPAVAEAESDRINQVNACIAEINRLRSVLAAAQAPAAPAVAAPEPRTLTDAQIERHGMPASECPPDSVVMLVSSIRRLLGMAAAPTTQEPQHG